MSNYTIQKEDFAQIDKSINIVIVRSEFNDTYTISLEKINIDFLKSQGFQNIETFTVPGALEIPGCVNYILSEKEIDLVICLGVIIQGDTPHFDHVCRESSRGIMDLTLVYNTPIINGILTCYNENQVQTRIRDVYAISGLKMLKAYQNISKK